MRTWIRVILALLVIAGVGGCAGNELVGTKKKNQPPEVWLASAPPEGTVANYTLHLFWGGWDPDGQVAYYEYAVTDNEDGVFDPADTTGADKWRRVFSNDSTFTFTADVLADSAGSNPDDLKAVDFVRNHTFFIRAVDMEGLASEKPDYTSFTARTLSPVVDIVVPRKVGAQPSQVPPITTIKWIGKDYVSNDLQVQDPDSVRWILVSTKSFDNSWTNTKEYIRNHPHAPEWTPWHYYRAPGDSGKSWTTRPLDFGAYVFAIQAKDEAGAVCPVFDEDRNMRRMLVSQRLTGPVMTVYNRYMGTVITSSPNTPPVIIDVPPNVPMSFRFTANATSYGGVASGYRYGWDILDLSDPLQWEKDYTPFLTEVNGVAIAESTQRTWQFDSHTFYVEVIDNSGYTSRVAVTVNIIPFTMQRSLRLIDDYDEAANAGFAATNGGAPSDEEHDAFWKEMLKDVRDFDPTVDVIEAEGDLPIQAVADYKAIIWDAYCGYNAQAGLSLLQDVIRFVPSDAGQGGAVSGKVTPNLVALYMAAGGHVLLCGEQPMTAVINPDALAQGARSLVFPLIFRYELTGDQRSPYEDSEVGVKGVGDLSFAYDECCLNVIDISVIANRRLIRNAALNTCSVALVRRHNSNTDGLRFTIPMDDSLEFPTLELRPEVAGPGKVYAPEARGLVNDIYNPPYFQQICYLVAETSPPRSCFQPMYGHGCLDATSAIYGAPVAFWTNTYGTRPPDVSGGIAARSAVMGFEPVFFNPDQVKQALDVILFEEWQLPRVEE